MTSDIYTVPIAAPRTPSPSRDPGVSLRLIRRALSVGSHVAPGLTGKVARRLFTTPRRHPTPEWEVNLARRGEPIVFKNGLVGHSFGEGPTVLLVHGWSGRGLQLGAFVKPLVEKGYRVVAFDGPAHGQSPGRQTHLPGFVDALLEIGQEIGPLEAVIGHSFGASASALAISRGLPVRRAILIAGFYRVSVVLRNFIDFAGLQGQAGQAFMQDLARYAQTSLANFDILEAGQRIEQPILLVHDRNDFEVPLSRSIDFEHVLPNGTLRQIEGFGHYRILRADPVITDAVTFIENKE